MAKEIKVNLSTSGIGSSLYGVLFNDAMQVYNAATVTFENFNPANYTAPKYCALTWTEVGSLGIYTMDMPPALLAGYYWLDLRRRLGGSPAQADPSQLSELWPVVWDATQVIDGLKLASPMKRNTAFPNFCFTMVASTDHASAYSGPVTGAVSLDGSPPVALSSTPSIVSAAEGLFRISFAASDLNGTTAVMIFSGSGADKQRFVFLLQP